jgi:hypothetical protein
MANEDKPKPNIKLGEQVHFIMMKKRDFWDTQSFMHEINHEPFVLYAHWGIINSIDGDDILIRKPGLFGPSYYLVDRANLYANADMANAAIDSHIKKLGLGRTAR